MSAFLPEAFHDRSDASDYPRLQQRPLSPAEQRARWAVRAAQFRAHEIAESIFGRVRSSSLLGLRAAGPQRGLLEMRVPFDGLEAQLAREASFLAAAREDPILARVPLVYVFAPDRD
jgi:hypothetical protein